MPFNQNILAISGSLRTGSSNHAILQYLGSLVPDDVDYIIYDGLAGLPHFDPGLDNDNPTQAVADLRKLLAEAAGVIICSPEYAYGVPGSLKNLLDWTVGSGSLESKPMALITASTGGEHAHAALLLILRNAHGANILNDATLLIPFVRAKMDGKGNITDMDVKGNLKKALDALLGAISCTA